MAGTVACPSCESEIDAVSAAKRINPACRTCGATWGDLHDIASGDDQPDPDNVEISRNHDGTVEVAES